MIPQEQEKAEPKTDDGAHKMAPAAPGNLEQALTEARQKTDEYLDSWKRAQADYINLKRRTEQEKLEMSKYATEQLITRLLPVLDDFERAFQHKPQKVNHEWVAGIKLIEKKLRGILEAQGVTTIEALGKPFDPNLHEACMRTPGEEGIVIQELSKGYKLYDKVIRASQVVVGNGETADAKPPEPEQPKK